MKKIIRLSSLTILFYTFTISCVTAQGNSKPVAAKYKRLYVGDKMPDILFKNIINYPRKNVKVSDFKGKPMILDFWSTGCSSCIEAFPKMEKLQKQFEGKAQIILVNPWESTGDIDKQVQRVKRSNPDYKIKFPDVARIDGDSTWTKLFPMRSVPTHVWVDGSGTIVAITNGWNATPEHIQDIIDGKKINMTVKDDLLAEEISNKGFLQPTLPSMPPVYYTAFIPFFATGTRGSIDSAKGTFKRAPAFNADPIYLFRTAYRDNKSPERERWLLEVKDAEQYRYPEDNNLRDNWYRKYCFTYEVQGPLKDMNNWQPAMQQDVNRFLGSMFGLRGGMEKRKMNALVLVKINDGPKMVSNTGSWDIKYTDTAYKHYGPFKYFSSAFYDYAHLENMEEGRVFVDETGIDKEAYVNIVLKGDLRTISLEDIRRQLQAYGLDIIKAEREVELLVIKDK